MRIGIDGISMSQSRPGGFHSYTGGLVESLARLDRRNEYVLFVDRPIGSSLPDNWSVVVLEPKVRGIGVAWREQVILPRTALAQRIDLLHCPAGTGPVHGGTRLVVTIHDAIEYSEPLPRVSDAHRFAMRCYTRAVQFQVASRAALVITGSHHAKGQIVAKFGIDPQKVRVVYDGIKAAYAPLDKEQIRASVLERRNARGYLMAIASLSPRKNIALLISAYSALRPDLRRAHPLVLVCTQPGAATTLLHQAAALGCRDSVHTIIQPSDDEMVELYNAAEVFVFPSLEEGFGLPPLEAMSCGTPVLASSASVMPEVLGDAPMYFAPTEIVSLSDALEMLLDDEIERMRLSAKGLKQAALYSWERTARQTLDAYHLAS